MGGELKEARKEVDTRVLSWTKRVSHRQASAEAFYSKASEDLKKLEVAVAHSNDLFTSKHAHDHLEHFLKRLESQGFNVSKAVKEVIQKRIASSRAAEKQMNQFMNSHASNSTNETDATGATGGATGATGTSAHEDASRHNTKVSFKVQKAELQFQI